MKCVKCRDNEAAFCAPCSDKWFGDPAFKKGLKQGRAATTREIVEGLFQLRENGYFFQLEESMETRKRLEKKLWSLIGGKL